MIPQKCVDHARQTMGLFKFKVEATDGMKTDDASDEGKFLYESDKLSTIDEIADAILAPTKRAILQIIKYNVDCVAELVHAQGSCHEGEGEDLVPEKIVAKITIAPLQKQDDFNKELEKRKKQEARKKAKKVASPQGEKAKKGKK